MMNGDAAEAIQFYQEALDAEVVFSQTFKEMPQNPTHPFPGEARDLISHAMLRVGDSYLMFSDNSPSQHSETGDQITLCLTSPNRERSERIFAALSEEGKIKMPLQETFFSPAYGIVTDKFGITFQIFTEEAK